MITEDFIPVGNANRPALKNPCLYITVHNTGNASKTATAKNHAAYLKSLTDKISWHYTVDEDCIVQHIPDCETAFHAGDGAGDGNRKSIGIEICENGDLLKATDRAVLLVRELMKKHGIPIENVVQHNHWSGKDCPKRIRAGEPYTWEIFLNKVKG